MSFRELPERAFGSAWATIHNTSRPDDTVSDYNDSAKLDCKVAVLGSSSGVNMQRFETGSHLCMW